MKSINQILRHVASFSPWKSGVLIFVIALAVRVGLIIALHPYRDLARYELERTAISLAQTGVLGNPYNIPTGPTAHVSPGYPLILAGIFHLFGTSTTAEIIKELVASIVTALQFALLPAVAARLSMDPLIGSIAGLVMAIFPAKPFVQIDGDWETVYTALFLVVLVSLTAAVWRNRNFSRSSGIMLGFTWGLALLFASVLLPIFAIFLVLGIFFCGKRNLARYLSFSTVQLAVVCFCLVPWAVRNERALGSPLLTRSNFGLELRVSNNDEASPDQRTNYLNGVYAKYHPLQSRSEAERVKALGEVTYNKEAADQAKEWIRTHPNRFIQLCLGRIMDFWFYPDPSKLKSLFGDLTAILGLCGLFWICLKDAIAGIVLGTILLVYPAPSYLIHVGDRQRYPVDGLLVLLSTAFVIGLVRRLSIKQP